MAAGRRRGACRAPPATAPGAEAARAVLRAAGEAGVECLTLYAFSSENWRRPAQEISDLTGLLRFYIQRELNSLHKEGIRLKILGDHNAFEADVAKMVDKAVERTAGNTPHDAGDRAQLRRPRRDVRAAPRGGRGRARSTRRRSSARSTPTICRRSTCSSAPRASSASPISCSGRRPMPNCCSSTRSGPISTATRCAPLWPTMRGASAATEAYDRAPPSHRRRIRPDRPLRRGRGDDRGRVLVAAYSAAGRSASSPPLAAAVMLIEWADMHRVPRLWA